ncbi:phosphoesterase [Haladaptatus salinisoli]|uniref:phosphoesterase n=1 Tax=Haladaptatus salinisoli TaxID=2884876 RepID=UPI001D0A1E3A|nr:phosphoesterase [Haladaptatus salinisoli]
MNPIHRAMEYYPYVFHPITVLGVGIIVLIHHEWRLQNADTSALWRRIAAFLGSGVCSLVPTAAYMLVTGTGPMETMEGNAWQVDALVASGVLISAGVTWYLWRRFEWGALVPGAMQALAAVTVPYMALSPFWNVSGHVIIALMPTLYLTLVARKFWPSLAIPVVMVPNRIILDAHTWAQTIGGFVIAAVIVVGLYRSRTAGSSRAESAAA